MFDICKNACTREHYIKNTNMLHSRLYIITVSNDTNGCDVMDELKVEEIVKICSRVSLNDGSLTFESYGTGEIRCDTQIFLLKHGLTLEDAESVINSLKVEDYYRGPLEHYDELKRKRDLWIFKKKAMNINLYIKLIPFNKNRYIAVVSFHEERILEGEK